MATGFPFSDRRQRPCVMGAAVVFPDAPRADVAPAQNHIEPIRAPARGRSYVDIATVPGGLSLPHRDVLG